MVLSTDPAATFTLVGDRMLVTSGDQSGGVMRVMSMRPPAIERRLPLTVPPGLQLGLGVVAVVAATIGSACLPASAGAWRVVPVALAALAVAAVCPSAAAVAATAIVGYLLVLGFLVNRYGVLSWHGTADLDRLALVAVATAGGHVAGGLYRRRRQGPPLRVPAQWSGSGPAEHWIGDKEVRGG